MGLTMRLMVVKIPLVLLCAAALAACTPNAAPVSTAPVSARPVTSLTCPKTIPAERRTNPWLPAAPRGLDGSARLAPLAVPARVIICAYIGPRSSAGKSGSVLLTGDLSGVMSDLAWIPPTKAGVCADYLRPADGDYYLIGLSYPRSTEWVAAPGNHCAGSSNGVFSSSANLSARASAWYQARHWTAAPTSTDACHPSGFGRLGQQSSMVPDHPVSVSLCEVSAAGDGKTTQRTEASGVGTLASALNGLRASPWQGQCKLVGRPLTEDKLLFGYVEGPPVLVSLASNCTPAINNGSLQANSTTTVLPLIRDLLGQR